jgi:hypothetical protein
LLNVVELGLSLNSTFGRFARDGVGSPLVANDFILDRAGKGQ